MTTEPIGEAKVAIVPSFEGFAETIDLEARKWGVVAAQAFKESFDETIERLRDND